MEEFKFSTIEEAVADLRAGKMIIREGIDVVTRGKKYTSASVKMCRE